MDFDTLKRVQDAVALIRSGKLDTLDPGRHELPDGAYVNVFGYQTKESGIYEAHRKYIDIHYVLEGSEIIMVADTGSLQVTREYDEEGDAVLGSAQGKGYPLKKGQFMVVFPEEAHLPGITADAVCQVKKAVVKVPV